MTKTQLQKYTFQELADFLDIPGGILYSGHNTLKKGKVYLLGYNPGGSGGMPIKNSIETMLTATHNAYLDEKWANNNSSWPEGEAPLQRRVKYLLTNLHLEPKEVCASNLIFFQSRDALSIDYKLAERCWPVHEAIMQIVQPTIILVFGNSGISPYGFLHSRFGGEEETFPSGHGNWNIKSFSTTINNKPVSVIGLPHLSRYSPIGKEDALQWIKDKFTH